MTETSLYGPLQVAASRIGARLFRNHVGVAKHEDADGTVRVVRTGLCPGSSDLIGWTPVVVTPEMVGRTVAVFTALEGKRPDPAPGARTRRRRRGARLSEGQGGFLRAVEAAGGVAGVFRSVAEGVALLRGGVAGVQQEESGDARQVFD